MKEGRGKRKKYFPESLAEKEKLLTFASPSGTDGSKGERENEIKNTRRQGAAAKSSGARGGG
ncbi:hypothetical protein, partial [Pontibacter beigongshangensis]|uniref:hypothetical protein n=1 Tax=Pontibacter beigongshangensis TaxID=2574733 RepID=UPI0019D61621